MQRSQKHQGVAGRAPLWDEAGLSSFRREWQTWFSDKRGVCLPLYIYLPVGVSALFIAECLSPTSRPLLASVSLSSLLAVSFSLSVNLASLCLCHITQSAQDAAAEACWQRRQEMMPTPRAGIRLITKMDSHLISIPPALPIHSNQTTVGDLTLDAPFRCVLQQDAFYMSQE